MHTYRLMTTMRFIALLFIFISLSGCSDSGSTGKKPLPESLSVIMTSPSGDVTITQRQSVDFQIKISGGTSPYTCLWDFGGGASNTAVENPGLIQFEALGDYTVKLTVTDNKGATVSASIKVTVQSGSTGTPPSMRYTTPANGATNVATTQSIQVVFTPGVDLSTITTSTFTLSNGSNPVTGTVTALGTDTATFTPDSPLLESAIYTATLTTGVKDIAGGDVLASDYTWSFTTIGYTLDAVITSPSGNVTIREGQSVNFQGSVTGGKTPYTFKWNFAPDIPPSTEQNPGAVTFSTRGTYTVVLRVTDATGHLGYDSVTVTVYSLTAGDWTKVSAGAGHTLALKSNGSLWAWGNNSYGQLGNGSHIDRGLPVQVMSESNCKAIAAGYGFSVVLMQDGTLWAWGQNDNGQLGDGTLIDKTTPVQVVSDINWKTVAAGYGHVLAIKEDGTLWAWGKNTYGQLGDSTLVDKNVPVQVGYGNTWTAVAAGYGHSLAVKGDGTLWAWGKNDDGQLGNGLNVDSSTPEQVGSSDNWWIVAAGYSHSLALTKDGSLWAWGLNNYGQLGDGTVAGKNAPTRVAFGSTWIYLSAGVGHSIGIKQDGSLWAWGLNKYGQLGDGTLVDKSGPVQVEPGSTWSAVGAGYYHSSAIKTGGTLWTWGYNVNGQLGNGTLSDSATPLQVKW
jgi:alpha-tubulin suppressor-like RCC1 family protein